MTFPVRSPLTFPVRSPVIFPVTSPIKLPVTLPITSPVNGDIILAKVGVASVETSCPIEIVGVEPSPEVKSIKTPVPKFKLFT